MELELEIKIIGDAVYFCANGGNVLKRNVSSLEEAKRLINDFVEEEIEDARNNYED